MHPRTRELLQYLDDTMIELRETWEAVPLALRDVRPAPDRWSAAENVHHLMIVERRVRHRLAELIEQARSLPPETNDSPILPTLSIDQIEVRARRFATSEASEPRDTDVETVWAEFEEAREKSRATIADGDGLALGEVTASHPALGAFTAYRWIAFLGGHAIRHAAQIREGQATLASRPGVQPATRQEG